METGRHSAPDLVVRDTAVLDPGAKRLREHCDVVVVDGRIVACAAGAADGLDATEVIEGGDLLLLPGLCNGHTHSPETLARGLADGSPLPSWLEAVWTDLDRLDGDTIRLAIQLCAAEMLHGGVTRVVDHFRQTPMTAAALDAGARAWFETGLRVTLAAMVRDEGVPHWVRSAPGAVEQLGMLRDACGAWHGRGGRLWLAAGPSAPTRCSDRLLEGVAALGRDHGIAVHMHVDETRQEVALAKQRYGTSAIEHLHRLGVLGNATSLAHCVWCSDEDYQRLADTATVVVHNPVSNARLGSGRAPLERMLERGVEVVIGTDGAASNDGQGVLEAVKMAMLLPRVAVEDAARWPGAAEVLAMATANGARAFGGVEAAMAPGCPADFAAFARDSLPLVPLHDASVQLALAGAALRARHVVIDGEVVLRDHRVCRFDEDAARAEALSRRVSR